MVSDPGVLHVQTVGSEVDAARAERTHRTAEISSGTYWGHGLSILPEAEEVGTGSSYATTDSKTSNVLSGLQVT